MRIKKLLPIIIICTMMVMALCSCSKGPSSATLLIYMCGSDLESQTGIASENLQELMSSRVALISGLVTTSQATRLCATRLRRES